jgi:uncharacterized protein YigE (DUF2233 family)
MEPNPDLEDTQKEQPTRPMFVPAPRPPKRARRAGWLTVAGYIGPLAIGLIGLTCAVVLMGWLVLRPRISGVIPQPRPTVTSTLLPRLMVTTLPTPTQFTVDEGWTRLTPGVERRNLLIPIPELGAKAPVRLVRLDPSQVSLRVHYTPGVWLYMHEWQTRMDALVIVNGGFYNSDGSPDSLLISNGVSYGKSYVGRGGMFGVTDGQPWLRALALVPYSSSEPVDQAVQGWPVLVYPGGSPANIEDDGSRTRRTAIGMDANGKVVLVVVDGPMFTLAELADWLASSDLGLVSAFNLDGGSSTGLVVDAGDEYTVVESLGPLPAVIAAYPTD